MATDPPRDPDLAWLDHVQPVGLVVAPALLKELGLAPLPQTRADNEAVAELLSAEGDGPALRDPWALGVLSGGARLGGAPCGRQPGRAARAR